MPRLQNASLVSLTHFQSVKLKDCVKMAITS